MERLLGRSLWVICAGVIVASVVWAALPAQSAEPGQPVPLAERVKTPKGELKNPFTDNPDAIAEGRKLYLSYGCNGCHGMGGGGMCPPLTNEVWVYGSDDDTLFRLIALGTPDLQKEGYTRKQREGVVGPMPPFLEIIKSDVDLWKVIAFIRSVYGGDPSRRNW